MGVIFLPFYQAYPTVVTLPTTPACVQTMPARAIGNLFTARCRVIIFVGVCNAQTCSE